MHKDTFEGFNIPKLPCGLKVCQTGNINKYGGCYICKPLKEPASFNDYLNLSSKQKLKLLEEQKQ